MPRGSNRVMANKRGSLVADYDFGVSLGTSLALVGISHRLLVCMPGSGRVLACVLVHAGFFGRNVLDMKYDFCIFLCLPVMSSLSDSVEMC